MATSPRFFVGRVRKLREDPVNKFAVVLPIFRAVGEVLIQDAMHFVEAVLRRGDHSAPVEVQAASDDVVYPEAKFIDLAEQVPYELADLFERGEKRLTHGEGVLYDAGKGTDDQLQVQIQI